MGFWSVPRIKVRRIGVQLTLPQGPSLECPPLPAFRTLSGALSSTSVQPCFMPLTRFGFSLRSFAPSARRSHTRRVVIPPRRYPRLAVASRTRAALEGFCRTKSRTCDNAVFHAVSRPLLPWSFPRPRPLLAQSPRTDGLSQLDKPASMSAAGLSKPPPSSLVNRAYTPLGATGPILRRRDAAKPSTSEVFSDPVGGLPKQPASHRVTLLLEALGGDVAAIRFAAPPSAFGRPRGFSSSSRLVSSCDETRPLPQA